jgi:cupredoxin-like protein
MSVTRTRARPPRLRCAAMRTSIRAPKPLLVGVLAVVLSLGIGGCGGADDNGSQADVPPPGSPTITIKNFKFSPLTVKAGTPVRVENKDAAPHDVTEVDEDFKTDEIGGDDVGAFAAPDQPGTYKIFCSIHPSMRGQVKVT